MRILTIIPEPLSGNRDNKNLTVRAAWCYLHGELEELNGYDIFSLLKSELSSEEIDDKWISKTFKEGIYPCVCFNKPCTFFIWYNNRRHSGLVVSNSDVKAYNYAKKCYEEKRESI